MSEDAVDTEAICREETTRRERLKRATPLCYVTLLPRIIAIGRELGYAICVHGSLVRDLDLVAVPWTEEAALAEELVSAIMSVVGGVFRDGGRCVEGKWETVIGSDPGLKPHGRKAWTIHTGAELYIDLSVMPRIKP